MPVSLCAEKTHKNIAFAVTYIFIVEPFLFLLLPAALSGPTPRPSRMSIKPYSVYIVCLVICKIVTKCPDTDEWNPSTISSPCSAVGEGVCASGKSCEAFRTGVVSFRGMEMRPQSGGVFLACCGVRSPHLPTLVWVVNRMSRKL